MKTKTVLSRLILKSSVGLLFMGLIAQVHATDKKCGTAQCSVPSDADCDTYQEVIVNGPLNGGATTNKLVMIANPSQKNCNESPTTPSFDQSFTDTMTIGGSVTLGYSTTASVQASLVGVAQVTAGCTASVSGTGSITGSDSKTTTLHSGPITLNYGQGVTWTVTGTKVSGNWSKTSYVKGYYYHSGNFGEDPMPFVTCQQATGSATASQQYYDVLGTVGGTWAATCP